VQSWYPRGHVAPGGHPRIDRTARHLRTSRSSTDDGNLLSLGYPWWPGRKLRTAPRSNPRGGATTGEGLTAARLPAWTAPGAVFRAIRLVITGRSALPAADVGSARRPGTLIPDHDDDSKPCLVRLAPQSLTAGRTAGRDYSLAIGEGSEIGPHGGAAEAGYVRTATRPG
jgi:hypothetical protein